MDNARIHRIDGVKLIKETELTVFTNPSYSPGLNKIYYDYGVYKN